MKEIEILAQALRTAFGGSAQGVADAVEILVISRGELDPVHPYYLPPDSRHGQGIVLLPRAVWGGERDRLLTRAIAHHFLRHREQLVYRLDEPHYEVDRFADAFAEHVPTAVDRPRRTALRAISR